MRNFLLLKAALVPLAFNPEMDKEPAGAPDYRLFYGLDKLPGQQRLGWLECSGRRLAVQYWLPNRTERRVSNLPVETERRKVHSPDAADRRTARSPIAVERRMPRGSVVISHGYYDHIGLYGHAINYWLSRGYTVIGMDMPGHGLSEGLPAVIGSFDEYGDALAALLQVARQMLPQPWTAFGQSMGCAVLLNYLMRPDTAPSIFCRLVLLAPLLRPSHWAISGCWSYLLLRHFLKVLPRVFSRNSSDARFLRFIKEEDPLQAHALSVEWVGAMKNWLDHFEQKPILSIPSLIIQGTKDDIVDWRHDIPHILAKLPQADLHYLKDAHHHLVNESEDFRAQMWQLLNTFCK